jgi:hypothetical protein
MLSRVARSGPIGAVLLLAGLLLRTSVTRAEEIPHFFVLCYHNIEDEAADQHYVGVTTPRLVEQLSWLERNDYRAVSVDDILAARSGRKPLPDRRIS